MSIDSIIGRGLVVIGAACASCACIQLLFQLDSNNLPFELSLPGAIMAVCGGVWAARTGLKMSVA